MWVLASRKRSIGLLRARRLRALSRLGLKKLPLRQRFVEGGEHAVLGTIAAIAAYVPTQLLGKHEGFWGAITALAVVQAEFHMARSTARDQLTGALLGGLIGVATIFLFGQHLWTYALAIITAILSAWLIAIPSAARLAAITATIILLVPHSGTPQSMMLSRVGEVTWGVVVAIVIVWSAQRLQDHIEGGAVPHRD
jgi:uncharacterized membrane protein YccC